jgi:hypothetical protein
MPKQQGKMSPGSNDVFALARRSGPNGLLHDKSFVKRVTPARQGKSKTRKFPFSS